MLGLAGVYLVAARLGLSMATIAGAASPVWPPTGVALAGLLLLGVSRWPILYVAATLASVLFTSLPLPAALLIGVGNTLEGVLGVLLLRRLGFSPRMERIQDVVVFAGSAGACTLASALPGALALVLSGAAPGELFGRVAWVWWLGNTLGALVVAPVLLLLRRPAPGPRWSEALALAVLTCGVSLWSFLGGGGPMPHAQVFLLFPLLVWGALRFGGPGATGLTVLIAGFSFWGTAAGLGPFTSRTADRALDLLELQLFLAAVALTGLLLAAARAERLGATAQVELLATAVRSAREGVLLFAMRPEGPRMVYANASFCERVGRRLEELVGRSPRELCAGGEAEVGRRLEAALREGDCFHGELAVTGGGGERVYGEVQLSPVRDAGERLTHYVATWRDLTAQKQLQARLVATERIAAVGMVAAGVGHELNNPLAYLTLSQEAAARSLGQGPAGIPEALARLECVREAAERLRVIVRDLKVFSREGGEERAMLDINAVVVPALRMAAHAVHPRARLVEEFGQPPRVLGNEARLGQVLLNLLVNALQAIPEGQPERHEVRVRTGRDASGQALVEVSDTGRGMPPSVLARIFDPFFTTRADGEGTGLGLAICQQIVQAHGGELRVRSEEGRGSTFTVLLPPAGEPPLAEEPPLAALPACAPPGPAEAPPRRRILIIDDEPRLAQSMRMLLEPSHDVSVTTRGCEALEWVREGQRFDLVLCDLQMPGTTGMDVYAHLRASAPELAERLVFISGGAYTQATRDFVRSVGNRILEKPVRPEELLATIDEELACARG